MSVNTKAGSDSASCATNAGPSSPLAVSKGHANHISAQRVDSHNQSLQNPTRIDQQSPRSSKLVRIVTVLAYIIAVSMAAIILSIYYTFIWNPYGNLVPIALPNNASLYTPESLLHMSANLQQEQGALAQNLRHTPTTSTLEPFSASSPLVHSKLKSAQERMDPVTQLVLSGGPPSTVTAISRAHRQVDMIEPVHRSSTPAPRIKLG